MYRKRILAAAASTAMLTTLFLAGQTLAAERVEVKVTSEPIGEKAACDKAGGFSLEFDSGTVLEDGDQITIDVDYTNATNYVKLCKDINIVIAPGIDADLDEQDFGGSANFAGEGFRAVDDNNSLAVDVDETNIAVMGTNSPVTSNVPVNLVTTEGGVIFHVHGNANSQRITVDVVGIDVANSGATAGNATLTIGADPDDNLIVRFLDQDVAFGPYADEAEGEIYIDDILKADFDDIYDIEAKKEHNTLCINVENWNESTVKGNMDSAGDKFTFIPSNPQIAHIVAAAAYTQYDCKDQNCGYIELGRVEQAGGNCTWFDNETAEGYTCANNKHEKNNLIIEKTNGVFEQVPYLIDVKILVNGVAGDNGVYFDIANDELTTEGDKDSINLCDVVGTTAPGTTYYLADGSTEAVVQPDDNDTCAVPTQERAVMLETASSNLGLGANDEALLIDLPRMIYDLSKVEAGDQVTVEVTIKKDPCGEVTTVTHCIGTFIDKDDCPAAAGETNLTYPYFTKAGTGSDAWWDGLAITNEDSNAGEATITMYENDGDVATAKVNVAAHSVFVKTLGAMISDGTFVANAGNAGTLGDSTCFLKVSTKFSASGFAMIAREATGESMGYVVGAPAKVLD